ncbi:gp58-like family protein [Lactiplantibacillus pentosus]|uniref:gp58-like family protein n=1 Tax=Lactiplantibacillus pentosus TaxID=1589 RepID=UPI0020A7D44A|nr:gp58-like family protein [Lactiplantibacillus pentosus]MDT7001213.1 gp58-like family protein [Lactiplantibacillus pentosus]
MIKQSDLALAAWKATERTLDAVVTINKIDYKTTDIASISYDAGGYTGDTFGIGSNYENSVTIKFSHLIEGLKPGMTVWPKIGIKTSNGYEYNSLGLFIVSDDIQMDRNKDETTIKAYDQMCLLEGIYTSKLTYPAKITSVIAEIANLAGVLLNTTDISRLPVQVNLPSAITGQTYRNAIGMIAQFYAGFATFDRDGKLTIRTITEPDYTLDPSQYEQGGLTKNEAPYKIGGIQCEVTTTTTDSTGQSTETTNTLQVGAASGSQIKLTNNLMTMDRLASIWQQLQSLTFYPFSLNWFGNPAIEAGDWLTLQDTKGNKFNVPNNGYTMTFDGSLSAVSKADQTSTSSSSYAWRGELSQYVADLGGRQGASGNYIYGTDTTEPPYGAKFNDIWYKQNGNKVELWTYERQADGTGKWVLTVSDATGEEVKAKVDQVELEAKASTDAAKAASDKTDQLAAKYDDTNALANQALGQAVGAQSDASDAVATANSTASEFGKVSQKTDSALTSALNAQSDASDAVKQASSAAADSKDAKQIAGAVSQSYKTLTDGSTMTIAELESGLAVKLTKTDLDGYATQTWTQNQIKVTADGINGTMSSIKSTVDGQTTSINDLKADSSSFKSQFTTVNNTLGKQSTDIGTLQATSKSLSASFDSLSSDNQTNQHNISQLQASATEFNNTLMTVQQQVTDSAVGTNLLTNTGDLSANWVLAISISKIAEYDGHPSMVFTSSTQQLAAQQLSLGKLQNSTQYTASFWAKADNAGDKAHTELWGSIGKTDFVLTTNWVRYTAVVTSYSDANTNTDHSSCYFGVPTGNKGNVYIALPKLELGTTATDWCPNPADNATVTAMSKLSQTIDGMKTDISKKIEQKDLNGYATQAWAQTQIKTTADGINGTISSVKGTVDSHTTSINTLQTDSNGFKSQFTKVNNTLGEHTTDIGTLKTSSKELSSNFSSLSTDNNTNKNDISQLKQTAKGFSSTLETVQTQVQNSAVGTNLLTGTSRDSQTAPDSPNNTTGGVLHRLNSSELNAIAGKQVTIRAFIHNTTTHTVNLVIWTDGGAFDVGTGVPAGTDGYSTITSYSITSSSSRGDISVRSYTENAAISGVQYKELKLEKGSVATDWCHNPSETATITALSSISQTVDTIQTTVRGKVDNDTYQSKMTQLDNQITTKVSQGDITNENILPYSGYWSDLTGWTLMSWGAADRNLNLIHHNFYHNAVDATLCVGTAMADTAAAGSTKFNVIPNTTYTMTFWGFASSNVKGTNVYVLGRTFASTKDYDYVHNVQKNLIMSPSGINKYTATFTTNSDETQAYVRLDNQGSTNGQSSGAYFAELKIERGSVATPYTRVSSGEIQVTSDNINLKVSKDGVVNAINISKEGTLIYGNKLHITAATYIDNAVIKDAMIANLSADKLTAGTINAANINVINLNANNITTGTIKGSNLSINLNTGNVEFQEGRIHNSSNTIDINVNEGYMSVANGSNRVMLKNGEMQFVEPGTYDTSTDPYLRISNTFGGQSTEGAAFIGRKYAVLTNSDNATGNEMFDIGLGTEKFSGIATGYGTGYLNSGWHMTKVGGAERGVVISGGKATSYNRYWSASPSIMVGATSTSTHSGGMNGPNIIMDCNYLYNFSTWVQTSSHAANVYVADDGAIVRASSASKYKTNIERSFDTGMGERILEIPTAHWFDKAEVRKKTLDPQAPDPRRYFGMIADDLDDAGLTELVEYNDKGEVEGLMYDRIALTIIPIVRNYRDRITKLESEIKQLKEG